jgi:hypothetical protein
VSTCSSLTCSMHHPIRKKMAYNRNWLPCSLELLQLYFSANEQCFSLITNQYKYQHKPNFSETGWQWCKMVLKNQWHKQNTAGVCMQTMTTQLACSQPWRTNELLQMERSNISIKHIFSNNYPGLICEFPWHQHQAKSYNFFVIFANIDITQICETYTGGM